MQKNNKSKQQVVFVSLLGISDVTEHEYLIHNEQIICFIMDTNTKLFGALNR